jgi:hypothetical protein
MLNLKFKILLEKTTKETRTTQNIKRKEKKGTNPKKKKKKKKHENKNKKNLKREKNQKKKNLTLKKNKSFRLKVEVQVLNTPRSRTCTYKRKGGVG